MAQTPIMVCKVHTPQGEKYYVTLLPTEVIFAHGLAPEAVVGVLLGPPQPGVPIRPEVFARNRVFVDFLHEFIAREAPGQPGLQAEARRLGNGWVYVIDQRTATPGGAVPPEDILGAFEVKNGEVVPGSYRPSPKHQILSANGFFQLDAALLGCLLRELEARSAKHQGPDAVLDAGKDHHP
jgi:hypothetical protein